MSRSFRFPTHRLLELIGAEKCPVAGGDVGWKQRGEMGRELRVALDLIDGPFVGFVLHVTCGSISRVTTCRAALILEGERVRGVDYSDITRKKHYQDFIVKGWHENVIDPNLPMKDWKNRNRHEPLPGFAPADLDSFLREICRMWHIRLAFGDSLI